jgi:hypothetical protein
MRHRDRCRAALGGALVGAALLAACAAPSERPGVPRSTLVMGVDVSGSFRGHYEEAIDFAAHYLYGHLHGLGELSQPTAVFVGSVGGERPGEAKSFQPIHTFENKTVEEIAAQLKELYPSEESYTDFNVFFDRVATLVKRQGLTLAPLNVVLLSDGVPDATTGAEGTPYSQINLNPLEYLSRSVTVRLLYGSPTVSVNWERDVERNRVRIWTVDDEVMVGWREHKAAEVAMEEQNDLWRWVKDNVDFRVRSRRL